MTLYLEGPRGRCLVAFCTKADEARPAAAELLAGLGPRARIVERAIAYQGRREVAAWPRSALLEDMTGAAGKE